MIPYDRAHYLLKPLFPNKEQYFEKIYKYWQARREEFKKPLLRKYWKDQKNNDKNMTVTFQRRDKERMRTRRHKKNDKEELHKLVEIKNSMEQYLLKLFNCIKDREISKKNNASLDYLCFKSENGLIKSNQIEKEYNEFLNSYQKPKYTSGIKPHHRDSDMKNKENNNEELKKIRQNHNNVLSTQVNKDKSSNKNKSFSNSEINNTTNNKRKNGDNNSNIENISYLKRRKSSNQRLKNLIKPIISDQKSIENPIKENQIEYQCIKGSLGRILIRRQIEGRNLFDPFDKTFFQELNNNNHLTISTKNKDNSGDMFEMYFNRFSQQNLDNFKIYNEFVDETDLEAFKMNNLDISSLHKQFLKRKREISRGGGGFN